MIEESLLKTHFMGRDGFRWWIGQIAPQPAQGEQINGGGWGNRFKVRILGYHPYSQELKDDDLPWAQVLLSPTDGSGAANRAKTVRLNSGDSVFGFFLDGDNAQVPVIMGVFGRTAQVPSTEYKGAFQPFTGYTPNIKNDGSKIVADESNESNATSQKSPRSAPPSVVKNLGPAERVASSAIGKKVTFASKKVASTAMKIKTEVENFVQTIRDVTDNVTGAVGRAKQFINAEIDKITGTIKKQATGLVNNVVKKLFNGIAPVLNQGLKLLYKTVYALVFAATGSRTLAHKAGVAAQAAMIGPVKNIADALPCIANKVINGLANTVKGIISSVADNVSNFVSCIGDQVLAGIMNTIIGGVSNLINPLLGGVGKILGGFSPLNFLRNAADSILGIAAALSCEEEADNLESPLNDWVIGTGGSDSQKINVQDILDQANQADSIASLAVGAVQDLADATGSLGVFDFNNPSVSNPGFKSPLGECYAGPPILGKCGGAKVKIFGSEGSGASAKAIITSIAGGGQGITGSVIGVDLVNGGGGYTFPPFVEIVDECKQGYGAKARAIVDFDETSPTYRQVTEIYIVSEGEGYPINDDQEDYIIDDVVIVDAGEGYSPDDTVRDSNGKEYGVEVDQQGRITKILARSIDLPTINERPDFAVIDSEEGFGAIFKARLKPRPIEPQGVVSQVIDCISKDDDFVGYVNGKKYYGPFHTHMGRKMTGASHTGSGQYIYDTPSESLGSSSAPVITTTTTTTTTTTSTPTATPSPTPTPTSAPPTTSGGGGSAPTPSPTPTPSPSPPSPPPTQGGGSSGGGY